MPRWPARCLVHSRSGSICFFIDVLSCLWNGLWKSVSDSCLPAAAYRKIARVSLSYAIRRFAFFVISGHWFLTSMIIYLCHFLCKTFNDPVSINQHHFKNYIKIDLWLVIQSRGTKIWKLKTITLALLVSSRPGLLGGNCCFASLLYMFVFVYKFADSCERIYIFLHVIVCHMYSSESFFFLVCFRACLM